MWKLADGPVERDVMRIRHLGTLHQTKHLRNQVQGELASQGEVPSKERIGGSILEGAKHEEAGKNLEHSNTHRRRYTSRTYHFPACAATR